MSISASSIIHRATDLLQDQTSVRWTVNELVRWLNDAQRAVIKVRPDSMNTTGTGTLSAGSRQSLIAMTGITNPSKLIEITRNVAATSQKKAVTLIPRAILDKQTPGWHSVVQAVDIFHYMFDPRDPLTFYVYPPATALAQLEIMYSAYPTDVAEPGDGKTWSDVTGNISMKDIYADDLLNFVLFRAYSKDSEYAGNTQRAAGYMQLLQQSLGDEIKATLAVQPQMKPGAPAAAVA